MRDTFVLFGIEGLRAIGNSPMLRPFEYVPKGPKDSARGFNPGYRSKKRPAPTGRGSRCFARMERTKILVAYLSSLQHLQPDTRVQFGLGSILLHSNTPSLRVAGFEDEDSDSTELAEVLPDEACGL
jgi:hypothetical protein